MLYENQSCPVCKRAFEEGDDIVYCPDCGTPHHRECYNLVGHCVNQGLHKANYSYYEEHKPQKGEPAAAESPENGGKTESASGAPNPFFPPMGGAMPNFDFTKNPYDNEQTTIDGESLGDVAAAVRSNAPRFVNLFKRMEQTKKSASWNWGAFIFGAYYLFFRKMYKQAITLFCVNITLSSLLSLLTARLAPKTLEAMSEMAELIAGGDTGALMRGAESIRAIVDYSTFTMLTTVFTLLTLAIRVCVGIFADKMYKGTVTDIIKKTNEQLNEGAAFSVPALSAQEDSINLSQEQMRRLYLSKRGGVTIWAPVAAYFVMQLISRLF